MSTTTWPLAPFELLASVITGFAFGLRVNHRVSRRVIPPRPVLQPAYCGARGFGPRRARQRLSGHHLSKHWIILSFNRLETAFLIHTSNRLDVKRQLVELTVLCELDIDAGPPMVIQSHGAERAAVCRRRWMS